MKSRFVSSLVEREQNSDIVGMVLATLFSKRTLSSFLGGGVLLTGLLVIIGWHFELETLKTIAPDYISMKFNTAVALVLFAIALLCLTFPKTFYINWVALVSTFFGMAIGLLTLLQYMFNLNFGIDELIYLDLRHHSPTIPPGRMAPVTALSFVVLGTSVFFSHFARRRKYRLSQILLIITMTMSMHALIGYILNVETSFGIAYYSKIAIHTALGFVVLSMGFLLLTARRGYLPILISSSIAGKTARRLMMMAIFAPPFFGYLEILGTKYKLFEADFGTLLRVVGSVAFFVFIIWQNTDWIHKMSRERRRKDKALQRTERDAELAGAILKSEARLRALVETAFSGIITVSESGKITDWNGQAETIFGWAKEEVIGVKNLKIIFPGRQDFKFFLKSQHVGASIKPLEMQGVRKDGEFFPMRLSISFVNVHNESSYTIFVEDISESKQKEKELIETRQQALRAMKVKSEFLTHMSHEIRTPLNGIMGMVTLLSKTHLNKDQRDFLQTIDLSSNVLLALINQILDLSKVETGQVEFTESQFDLRLLIESTVTIVDYSARTRGIELVFNISPDAHGSYIGDPFRIQQILLNLLNNAVKFSDRGTVSLTVRKTEEFESKVKLVFEVIDEGIGLVPESLHRIFQPFSQESTMSEGTGVGLALSKQLVELMGGQLRVESVRGKGSTFSFDIFLTAVSERPAVGVKQGNRKVKPSKHSLGHILVVEDNKVNQEVVVSMLKILGCSMVVAQNGVEALEALRKENFDMILMDCQMPEMDGYEATRRIRNGEAGEFNRNIPIIAVTANAIQGSAQKCLDVGMNDYTSKPVQFEDFEFKIKRWLSRGRGMIERKAIDMLRELAVGGNKNLVKELINLFKHETVADIQKMRTHIEDGNFEAVGKIAHHLKSSCANLGAYKMQEISEKIEKLKTGGSKNQFTDLVDSLVREYHIAADELQKYMSSQS